MAERELTGHMLRSLGGTDKMTESELQCDIAEYQPMLFRLAYSYTGSRMDCDDIMQEVFIKLYFRGRGFNSKEEKKAWLICVTINLCKNYVSAWWRKKRQQLPDGLHNDAENSITDTAKQAKPFMSDDDCFIELNEALRRLDPKYRAVIHLYYYEGFSVSEISGLLGISISAVTTRLQRGREKLKGMLTE